MSNVFICENDKYNIKIFIVKYDTTTINGIYSFVTKTKILIIY